MKSTLHYLLTASLTLIILSTVGLGSAFSQMGCTEELACNYDPAAIIDDGSCIYLGYFIPVTPNAGPAILACEAPEGYYFPDQVCVNDVIAADPFCLEILWDDNCEAAFNTCLGCSDPNFYVPFELYSGTAIEACTTPAGYYLPDQTCVSQVIGSESSCTTLTWNVICQFAYHQCAFGCSLASWQIPVEPGGGPAILECAAIDGYYAPDHDCVIEVLASDLYCSETNWDILCEDAYNSCLGCSEPQFYIPYLSGDVIEACTAPDGYHQVDQDCLTEMMETSSFCFNNLWYSVCLEIYDLCAYGCDAAWHIPYLVGSGPAIYGCEPPEGYYTPDQTCVTTTLSDNNTCDSVVWDTACQSSYDECFYGCTDANWYLPCVLDSGPAVYDCSPPEGYYLADQDCIDDGMEFYTFCIENTWDAACQVIYNFCLLGCEGDWYIPYEPGTGPAYFGCSENPGYFLPDQDCVTMTLAADSYCADSNWDGLCQTSYEDCTHGCEYPDACNYDPLALHGDGSCLFPGCIDPLAENYNSAAGCDNGSCIYLSCDGDLDGDGFVNTADLLIFLAKYGSICP
jgi:hypothetical protein